MPASINSPSEVISTEFTEKSELLRCTSHFFLPLPSKSINFPWSVPTTIKLPLDEILTAITELSNSLCQIGSPFKFTR